MGIYTKHKKSKNTNSDTTQTTIEENLSNEEIIKLKQLVCSHENTKDKDWKCSCCQQFNQICQNCGLEIEHTCNDHDTEDGYCDSCR